MLIEQENIRILGLFAHPDDEVFCVGGTLAKYIAAGAEAMVVSFTRGEAGQIRDAGIATRRGLGARREQELYASVRQLGVQHVRCLDYGDGKLSDLPLEVLAADATAIIRAFQPDIVVTFDDTGAYGHPDHIAVSRATTIACRYADDTEWFPEHLAEGLRPYSPARLYHSYFPRNNRLLLRHLAEWLIGLDSRYRGTDQFMQGLRLFADESSLLGYAADHVKVEWYPAGFYIVEQGEPPASLYLILSGSVDILQEDSEGNSAYIETHQAGVFFGETGVTQEKPRNAHVVAASNVTCLVLSPAVPTLYEGRGEQVQIATAEGNSVNIAASQTTTCIDVRGFVDAKLAAMSEHRTQYTVTPDMFPRKMSQELLGYEYFIQVLPSVSMQTELLHFPPQSGPFP